MYNIKKIGWDSESNIKLERSMSYSYYFCFQDFNDKKKNLNHQMEFKRGNDPCSGELSYKSFN